MTTRRSLGRLTGCWVAELLGTSAATSLFSASVTDAAGASSATWSLGNPATGTSSATWSPGNSATGSPATGTSASATGNSSAGLSASICVICGSAFTTSADKLPCAAMRILVLGAGRMGFGAVHDLIQQPDVDEVTV